MCAVCLNILMRLYPEIAFYVDLIRDIGDMFAADAAIQLPQRSIYLPIGNSNGPYRHGDLLMLAGQNALYLQRLINTSQIANVVIASEEQKVSLYDNILVEKETPTYLMAGDNLYMVWEN